MMTEQPHIVIIGGGFGGLYAAQHLKYSDAKVTLIDRRNFHLFQPYHQYILQGFTRIYPMTSSAICMELLIAFRSLKS